MSQVSTVSKEQAKKEWCKQHRPNDPPRQVSKEIELVEAHRTKEHRRKLPLFDLHRKFPHDVAHDEAAQEEHAKVVQDEVAGAKASNWPGFTGSSPN